MDLEVVPGSEAYYIPVNKVWLEPMFNPRSGITLISVQELARSIESKGLQIPIVVQPRSDVPQMPETYDYRLIVGFRRFTACTRILRMEKIKATIVYGLTEEDAKVANFLENVARDNLNILEEARGLAGMFPENTPYSRIASSIKKHRDWVAIRFMLLKLSEPIQEAASNGLITQTDIRLIYSAPAQCRTNVFKRIISHKGTVKGFKTRTNPYKPPTSADIQERLRLLVNNGFGGILAKLLIWSGGLGITNDEIDSELQQMFIKYNKGNLEVKDFIGAYNISNSN